MSYDNLICLCRTCWVMFPDEDPEIDRLEPHRSYACPGCAAMIPAEPEQDWFGPMCAAQNSEWTPERRAKVGLANSLHPRGGAQSPEAKLRISMNRITHGGYCKVHLWPKARPGRLYACKSCSYAPPEINDHGNNRCVAERWLYCEAMMPELAAFANAHAGYGHEALKKMVGGIQAILMHNLKFAALEVMQEGPSIESDVVRLDGEGNPVVIGTRRDPHPALKSIEVHSRTLDGISLPGWELTPKSETDRKQTATVQDAVSTLAELFTRGAQPPAANAPALDAAEES